MAMRVIATKVGLDGHDSGIQYVARGLMRAGMEVIYLGKYHTAEEVAAIAAEEDADVIAASFLSSEYRVQVPRLKAALGEVDADDVKIVVGGLVVPEDEAELIAAGAAAVFGSATDIEEVVDYLRAVEREKEPSS